MNKNIRCSQENNGLEIYSADTYSIPDGLLCFRLMKVYINKYAPEEGWNEVGFWDAIMGLPWVFEPEFCEEEDACYSYNNGYHLATGFIGDYSC